MFFSHSFCDFKRLQRVTVLAVKQLNPEKLEMFSKAHGPKNLKLLCIESLDGSRCSFPIASDSFLCNAGAGNFKGDSARLLDEAVVTIEQMFRCERPPDRHTPYYSTGQPGVILGFSLN